MTELDISNREVLDKNDLVFAVCEHGHSRSKMISRVLRDAGYLHTRAVGVDTLTSTLKDRDLSKEFSKTRFVICASPEIESRVKSDTRFKGKVIITLDLTESDHSISRFGSQNKRLELRNKIVNSLMNKGIIQT